MISSTVMLISENRRNGMNPTSVALWSLGVLFILKLIGYLVYRHFSKKKVVNDREATHVDTDRTNNEH